MQKRNTITQTVWEANIPSPNDQRTRRYPIKALMLAAFFLFGLSLSSTAQVTGTFEATASKGSNATITISDNNPSGRSGTINFNDIPGSAILKEITVTLAVDHQRVGDLKMVLTAPTGDEIVLVNRPARVFGPNDVDYNDADLVPSSPITFTDAATYYAKSMGGAAGGLPATVPFNEAICEFDNICDFKPDDDTGSPKTFADFSDEVNSNGGPKGIWTVTISDLSSGGSTGSDFKIDDISLTYDYFTYASCSDANNISQLEGTTAHSNHLEGDLSRLGNSFIPDCDGQIESLRVFTGNVTQIGMDILLSVAVQVHLYKDPFGTPQLLESSEIFYIDRNSTGETLDVVFDTPQDVLGGETYAFQIENLDSYDYRVDAFFAINTDPYPAGELVYGENFETSAIGSDWDMKFEINLIDPACGIDTDNDSVEDCNDQELNSPCPNDTDANGVSNDDDNDGVANCEDNCEGLDDNLTLNPGTIIFSDGSTERSVCWEQGETFSVIEGASSNVPDQTAVLFYDEQTSNWSYLSGSFLGTEFTVESIIGSPGTFKFYKVIFGDNELIDNQGNLTGCYALADPITLIAYGDTDTDGVCDLLDQEVNSPCPDDVDANGVSNDDDNDGVTNCLDQCEGEDDTLDDDNDGILNCNDQEPNSPCPDDIDENGVSNDDDNDGVLNCNDQEPNSPCPDDVDVNGVSNDDDSDGIPNCITLTAGDIAFIGSNTDPGSTTADNVTFVFLTDVAAGTQIIFTDRGWSDATGFGSAPGDGELIWTSATDHTEGDIITLDLSPGNLSNGAEFSTHGDQLFAIQGSIDDPFFIAGLHFNVLTVSPFTTDENWDGDNNLPGQPSLSNQLSALPDALENGNTAVRLLDLEFGSELDNFRFDCYTTGRETIIGSPYQIRSVLHSRVQWEMSNTSGFDPPAKIGCGIEIGVDTEVSLSEGKLTITDVNGGDTDDNIVLWGNGPNLIIDNLHGPGVSGGPTLINHQSVEVPLASITNGIECNGEGGFNTIVILGNIVLPGENNDITLNDLDGSLTQISTIDIGGDYTINGNVSEFNPISLGELVVKNLSIQGVKTIGIDQFFGDPNKNVLVKGTTTLQANETIDIDRGSYAGELSLAATTINFIASSGDLTFGTVTATDPSSSSDNRLEAIDGNIYLTEDITTAGESNLALKGDAVVLIDKTITTNTLTLESTSFEGSGAVDGNVEMGILSTLNPGTDGTTEEITINGDLRFFTNGADASSNATFAPFLESKTSFDRLQVNGTVDLSDADFAPTGGFLLQAGDAEIILIDNDGVDAVIGAFNGLSEGAFLTAGQYQGNISYIGGDGNDVVLLPCQDSDNDGILDCDDQEINSPCPDDVDPNGVSNDDDNDGVANCLDQCEGEDDTLDDDNDGIPNCIDICSGSDNLFGGEFGFQDITGVIRTNSQMCLGSPASPTISYVEVVAPTPNLNSILFITNTSGDVISTQTNTVLDFSTYPAGGYLVTFVSYDDGVDVDVTNINDLVGCYVLSTQNFMFIQDLDEDGDGVQDCVDQELNSPCPGDVDENGVSKDDDNDGILNCEDTCPSISGDIDAGVISLAAGEDIVITSYSTCLGSQDATDINVAFVTFPTPGVNGVYVITDDALNIIATQTEATFDFSSFPVGDYRIYYLVSDDETSFTVANLNDLTACFHYSNLILVVVQDKDEDGDGVQDCDDQELNSPCPDDVDANGVSNDGDEDGKPNCIDPCPDIAGDIDAGDIFISTENGPSSFYEVCQGTDEIASITIGTGANPPTPGLNIIHFVTDVSQNILLSQTEPTLDLRSFTEDTYLIHRVAFSDNVDVNVSRIDDLQGCWDLSNVNAVKIKVCQEPPVAVCQNITVNTEGDCLATITATQLDGGSSDPNGDELTFSMNEEGPFAVGLHVLTLTVGDGQLSSTCTATVTVEDNTAPNAICQDVFIQLDENGLASITATAINNGSNDACGLANLSLDKTSFDCTNLGDNTVTLTATDLNANSNFCQAMVTIVDNTEPSMTCPGDMTVNTDQGECGAYVTLPKAAPADNCGIKNLKSRYRTLDEQGDPVGSWSSWADDHSGFFELGTYEIQWRAKDEANNKGFCSYQLHLIDEEAPVVVCTDLTIDFNGEATLAIDASAIFDADASFDACGPVTVASQSISEVNCQSVGETLAIQVVGIDPNGNTSTCMAQVTVVGMPCSFEATDIDCENGASASYDPVEESFTLTANDCEGYPDGEFSTVMTELCGDGEIIAKVASLVGDGRAGVIMMENLTPDARFVSSIKDRTPRVRTEYRSSTGGNISYKSKNRSRVEWLRIVRDGSKFKTYTSTNGSYWRKSHTIEYETFANCIQIGLIAYSKNANESVTAVFENVKVIGDSPNTLEQVDGIPVHALQDIDEQEDLTNSGIDLEVAPNPFAEQTQIEFTLPTVSDVTLEIYNLHGQRVQSLENAQLDAGIHRYQWDGQSSKGESLPTGIYMLRLHAGERWFTTKVSLVNR